MEHLKAAISGPPFRLVEVLALQSNADQLADTMESDSEPFDHEASVRMIEALEALAAVALKNYDYLHHYFQDFDRFKPGTPEAVANIRNAFQRLPDQVCRLKALLFRALNPSDLCSPSTPPDAAPVCQYCNWILERALIGVDSAGPLVLRREDDPLYGPAVYNKGIVYSVPIEGFHAEQEGDTFAPDLSGIGIYRAARDEVLGDHNVDFLRRVLGRPQEDRVAGFRPKRLIDLGPESTSDLRLVISPDSSQEAVPYAALSYCWGPPEDAAWQLMTTPESAERHCAHISRDALPPVVKDAVEIEDQVFCENGTHERITDDGANYDPCSAFFLHLGNNDKQHLFHKWYQLVPNLVDGKGWTDDRDILPALSGTSRIFAVKLEDRFLAGLWETDLHTGLLFTHLGIKHSLVNCVASFTRGQGRLQCAPSWSWASRHRFQHYEITEKLKCQTRSHMRGEMNIIESRLRVDGNNPYGRLMMGRSLLVAGRAIAPPAGCFITRRGSCSLRRFRNGCIVDIDPDWACKWGAWHPPLHQQNMTPLELKHQAQRDAAQAELYSTFRLLLVSSCCSRQRSGPATKPPLVREEREDQIWPGDRELTQQEQEDRDILWEMRCREYYEKDDIADAFFDDGDLDQATASAGCSACLGEAEGASRDC
ncbi:hypothetical protein RB595_010288 [Gaeumannomyces hyphopodioides]